MRVLYIMLGALPPPLGLQFRLHRCLAPPSPTPTPSPPLQLMTWGASTISLRFAGSSSVEVVINGSLAALPEQDQIHALAVPTFPRSYFQARDAGRGSP